MKRPVLILIAAAGYVLIALYVFVLSEVGIINQSKVRSRIAGMERDIAVMTNENARLVRDIERMSHDASYVKALAKTYGFRETSRERIVVFIDDKIRTNKARAEELTADIRESQPSYFVLIVFAALTILLYIIIRTVARRKRVP
ncbi:MAG: septum formation initiator family protein [Spirochaetota bacterium]